MKMSDCGRYTLAVGQVIYLNLFLYEKQDTQSVWLIDWQSQKTKLLHQETEK